MKHRTFDLGERVIPSDWISGTRSDSLDRGPESHESHKWMAALSAPLEEVRRCALQALTEMNATLAYLYENEEKVVIRCTLPQRQIRAELKRVDERSTRMVVVTMHGADVDRATSGRILDAIEHKLNEGGEVLNA
jgi:hypothetical protein